MNLGRGAISRLVTKHSSFAIKSMLIPRHCRVSKLVSGVVEESRKDRISALVTRRVKLSASPASKALSQAVEALQIFVDMSTGEEASLKAAPEEVQEKARSLVKGTKDLIAMINTLIGLSPEEKEAGEKEVEKEVAEKPVEKPEEEE